MPPNAFAIVERLNGANSFAKSEAALEKVLARFGLENFIFLDAARHPTRLRQLRVLPPRPGRMAGGLYVR